MTESTETVPVRPDAIDGAGVDVWQSYNAMETTKRRHFALLETLDLKRTNYGIEPSAEETRRLAWLLADHDAQVRRFAASSVELKAADPHAHTALFDYIGRVVQAGNTVDDEAARTH